MDLVKHCEKTELKELLKKYLGEMSIRNNSLKIQLLSKQQMNNNLKANNEQTININQESSKIAINVILHNVHCQMEEGMDTLETKTMQVNKCIETINVKVDEEIKKLHKRFYEMTTRDELALKPYHEVEKALNNLKQETDCCKEKLLKEKELFKKVLQNRAEDFLQLKEVNNMLEPLVQEIKHQMQELTENVEKKLKSLKLKCIEDASENSEESKELLGDLDNLKSQINTN